MTINEFKDKHPTFHEHLERYAFSGGYHYMMDEKFMTPELLADIDSCHNIHVTTHSCGSYRIIFTFEEDV